MSQWAIKRLIETAKDIGAPTSRLSKECEAARVEFRAIVRVAHVVAHPEQHTEDEMRAVRAFMATLADEEDR